MKNQHKIIGALFICTTALYAQTSTQLEFLGSDGVTPAVSMGVTQTPFFDFNSFQNLGTKNEIRLQDLKPVSISTADPAAMFNYVTTYSTTSYKNAYSNISSYGSFNHIEEVFSAQGAKGIENKFESELNANRVVLRKEAVGQGSSSKDSTVITPTSITTKTISATSFVSTPKWKIPDYVFENDYKLMPLKDVETFVKANNHLPEVPSAAEIKKNGMDMTQMNILLLKKVEELTLHSISLQKELQKQQKQINKLQSSRVK